MSNPLVQAMHRGQEEFASNPFGALFLGLTAGGLTGGGGGGLLKLAGKLLPIAKTTRVFWSGGNVAKNAAMAFAKANGFKTLEMTIQGKILTRLTKLTSIKFTRPLWDKASASFAKGSLGPTNVFQSSAGVSLRSTWRRIEYDILKDHEIIYHIVN